ncbi:MAG: hypothetical protein NVV63_18310 [Opitutus sp.]|nr:hypothetical protein [Opitutus sp.]
MNPLRPLRFTLGLLLGASASTLCVAATSSPLAAETASVQALLQRQELAPYRGWLKFLQFRAEQETARHGADSEAAKKSHRASARVGEANRRRSRAAR